MKKRFLVIVIVLTVFFPAVVGVAQDSLASTQIGAIIGNDTVVLGDVTFKISADALFFRSDKKTQISLSGFKEGDWVEFSINSDGQIDEMWLSSE